VRRKLAVLLALAASALLLLLAANETFVWVDDRGVTHLSNDPEAPGRLAHPQAEAQSLDTLWGGPLDAKPPVRASLDREEARIQRQLAGAVEDLRRGENARAAIVLEGILRERPTRPEPHWYLALLDRHRGRHESAEAHLRAFLASSGDSFEPRRASAEKRLDELAEERSVAEGQGATDPSAWATIAKGNFRLSVDPALGRGSSRFGDTVLRYLEDARSAALARLGAAPDEAMGVVLYGRGAYDRAHADRFSFRTVGFFDGRMHVVSAAYPAGELRSLLFHEYVHAVFRERTGGDRPYWLNEGLAELSERQSRAQTSLSRSERSLLHRRRVAGAWIPLRRLAPSFSGLTDDDARVAYLEAAAAAAWLEQHTQRDTRGRLLEDLGRGRSDDDALRAAIGIDTDALDAALQQEIGSEFASRP
jgi:tetratricopeptide (TPR) repeat protein